MHIHDRLIALAQALDYPQEAPGEEEGFCFGFSVRWIEACLLGEKGEFEHRIKLIEREGKKLLTTIQEVKNQVIASRGKPLFLNQKGDELLQILAFIESMVLYQKPEKHNKLFNAKGLVQNHLANIAEYAGSWATEKAGGLTCPYTDVNILTLPELTGYLDELASVIKGLNPPKGEVFGFLLGTLEHALVITYQPSVGWQFMDINTYPAVTTKDTSELAAHIASSLGSDESDHLALKTKLVTFANNPLFPSMESTFKTYKKMRLGIITEEMAERSVAGVKLIHLAATIGDEDILTALSKHHPDYEVKSEGFTPLQLALGNRQPAFIPKLVDLGASLTTEDDDGWSAPHFAACSGRLDLILAIAKYPISWEAKTKKTETPLFLAALNGHDEVVAQLMQYGVNTAATTHLSADYLESLAADEEQEVKDRVAAHIKAQSNPKEIIFTPYEIAVLFGHKKSATLLQPKITPSVSGIFAATKAEIQEPGDKENIPVQKPT